MSKRRHKQSNTTQICIFYIVFVYIVSVENYKERKRRNDKPYRFGYRAEAQIRFFSSCFLYDCSGQTSDYFFFSVKLYEQVKMCPSHYCSPMPIIIIYAICIHSAHTRAQEHPIKFCLDRGFTFPICFYCCFVWNFMLLKLNSMPVFHNFPLSRQITQQFRYPYFFIDFGTFRVIQ